MLPNNTCPNCGYCPTCKRPNDKFSYQTPFYSMDGHVPPRPPMNVTSFKVVDNPRVVQSAQDLLSSIEQHKAKEARKPEWVRELEERMSRVEDALSDEEE